MKLITRDTDYAIRALCFIAKNSRRKISVSELVKTINTPLPFLRKNLQILNKKGILQSSKGAGGGFELAISPQKIFIMDLMNIFKGPFKLNECILKKKTCPNIRICALKKKIDRIEKRIVSELKSVTIASLLK